MTALHSAAVQCGTNFPLLGNYVGGGWRVATKFSVKHQHIFTQQGKIGPVDTAALCSAVT